MKILELRKSIKDLIGKSCYWMDSSNCVEAINAVVDESVSRHVFSASAKQKLKDIILKDRCLATDIMFDWLFCGHFYLTKAEGGLCVNVIPAHNSESFISGKPLKISKAKQYFFYNIFKVKEHYDEDPDTAEVVYWLEVDI